MKKLITALLGLSIIISSASYAIEDNSPFQVFDTPHINGVSYDVYEYYTPDKMTPLIAQLPEFRMSGPGYFCDLRQPAPVYRFPIQQLRHMGYREADWHTNKLLHSSGNPVNFGGYTY